MSSRGDNGGVLSVSDAMALAKGALEGVSVRLVGEVSEVSNKPGYKAVYFTVKDERAALPCMMWNNLYRAAGIQLCVGQLVELTGRFTLYAAKGRMNFDVHGLALAGEGNLRLAVERLARRLEAEGLMRPERKRALPAYPAAIGVVTSPRGAAVHDVLRTLRRRFPVARVLLAGVPVEGARAAEGIAAGIRCVVGAGAEVVLVVRGGGSYEDLMPFNDEGLARVIAACPVPVVTGIGHEPDNSIADMVADVRASTPTAAAEAVSPARASLDALFDARARSMTRGVERVVERASSHLASLASRPVLSDPKALFAAEAQGLDYARGRLSSLLPSLLDRDRERVADRRARLARALPAGLVHDRERLADRRLRLARALPSSLSRHDAELASASARFVRAVPLAVARESTALRHEEVRLDALGAALLSPYREGVGLAAARLHDLSPLSVLARGYALARTPEGAIVKSIEAAPPGSQVKVTVSDGTLSCRVEDTTRKDAS